MQYSQEDITGEFQDMKFVDSRNGTFESEDNEAEMHH
jgi:hypothetical protein